jgi:AraC-like DNA-binding protein
MILWSSAFVFFHLKFSYQEVLIDELPQSYRFFSDSAFGSVSTCEHYQKDDTTVFSYFLIENKGQYSFANHVAILDEAVDVSGYDNFQYTLKGDHPDKLRLFLVMEIPEDSVVPTHTIEYLLKDYTTDFEVHTIPLQEFQYHEYWISSQNINEKELGEFNFTNMKALVFGSGVDAKIGRHEKIEFHSVKFTKTITWPYYLFIGIMIIAFLYWWTLSIFKNKNEVVSIKYAPLAEKDKNHFPSVVQFITDNYMNPHISVTMACDNLDISEAKLTAEVKNETSLTFKLLLNQLRIEEAKRLLFETELLISNIADQIGYENVTNFNRVFKKEVKKSPSEYRKLSKQG